MLRILAASLLLAACAPMSEGDCRGNGYALGERDALAGSQPQIDRYARECSRYGIRLSEPEYMAGWGAGYSEWNNRVSRGRR
jgi:hypothetical protein